MRALLTSATAVAIAICPSALAQNASAPATAPAPTTQAATAPSIRPAEEQQRILDLIALIEGQNTPAARRTGARELLRANWSETRARLTHILTSGARPARVAVAQALADLPQNFDPAYIEPLLAMLGDSDADCRSNAILALTAARLEVVIERLAALATDAGAAQTARLAAVEALGKHTKLEAIAALASLLSPIDGPYAAPALAAIEHATAFDFDSAADAQDWWSQYRDVPVDQWQQLQIDRLVRQSAASQQRVRELEQRLTAALREAMLRTPESERGALLNSYLSDPSDVVRLSGLELVQAQLTEGRTLTPETIDLLRATLKAPERSVRGAAVRAVASLRDPADAERFQQMLGGERDADVRLAIIYGLGYVGASETVASLLGLLTDPGAAIAAEAIVAVGRLAERNVLDAAARDAVATALLDHFQQTPREEANGRERVIRAMTRLADPRFGQIFIDSADAREPATVRGAALRGIASLADPKRAETTRNALPTTATSTAPSERALVDAIVPAAGDADLNVRRVAVDALAQVGTSDAHLQVLLTRLATTSEVDEGIRASAWRGVQRIAAAASPREIDAIVERLPDSGTLRQQRTLELLVLAEKASIAGGGSREELGLLRCRIGLVASELSQPAEAISAYSNGVRDLVAAKSARVSEFCDALAMLALRSGRFDADVSKTLSELGGAVSGDALWTALRGEIERISAKDGIDRALDACAALRSAMPTQFSQAARDELEKRIGEMRQTQATRDLERVRTALETLKTSPRDEAARTAIAALGPRAASGLRDTLRTLVTQSGGDAEYERLVHDLLRAAVPAWGGYALDAPQADKLAAIEAAPV
ncbi:MAG: HEAT repeat domain-containing protein [Phycisphaerae bacterium]